jgi:hypothetical protein
MKEHPILFTGPMVRAILEGRKTQTRRPVKVPKGLTLGRHGSELIAYDDEGGPARVEIKRPFAVGDRLWVRETFSYLLVAEEHHYVAGGDLQCRVRTRLVTAEDLEERDGGPPSAIAYKASHTDEEIKSWGVHRETWRPSIHMPRWASRITLEVTDIRPERVRDIGCEGAIQEGVHPHPDVGMFEVEGEHRNFTARASFAMLWDGIYGEGPLAWANNPWTWATTFKVVKP